MKLKKGGEKERLEEINGAWGSVVVKALRY